MKLNSKFFFALCLLIIGSNIHAQQIADVKEIDQLLINGKYNEAITLLKNYVEEEPDNFLWNYKLGVALQGVYKYSEASKYLFKASKLNSNDIDALIAFARNFTFLGNTNIAARIYTEVIEKDPDNLFAKSELAKIYLENSRYDDAAKIYSGLIDSDSSNSYFYKQLGFCKFNLKKIDDATELYKKAFKLNSYDSGALFQIAKIYFVKENYDSSYTYIKKALSINPTNLAMNKFGGEIFIKMKKYRSAKNQFEFVTGMGDSTAQVMQKLGFCYYYASASEKDSLERAQMIEEGKNALTSAYNLEPKDALTTFYLGLCYKEEKDFTTAITFLNKTINNFYPEYIVDVYTQLGSCYESDKKFTEAISSYKEALAYKPSKFNLIFQLAAIYDKLYADRSVPLIYYKKFLKEGTEADQKLIDYAQFRIEKLIEENHFRGTLN